jgi:Spx/MgsR family transcriptional regulator
MTRVPQTMAPIALYGIPNCDTVRQARAWLAARGIAVAFHDFRKAGVPAERLDAWIAALGWETLLNRKSSTWRQLDEPTRAGVTDAASARALMLAQPSLIKRPVTAWGSTTTVGFDPKAWPPT